MFVATIRKDLTLLVRDRGALLSLFLLPVIFIGVFGSIFGGDSAPDPIELSVWHEEGDDRAAAVVTALESTGMFDVTMASSAATVSEACTCGVAVWPATDTVVPGIPRTSRSAWLPVGAVQYAT